MKTNPLFSTPRTEEEYLETRVKDQIQWYENKSKTNKRYYLFFKISELVLSLPIPFLSAYIDSDISPLKLIVGILGVLIAAVAGILTLVKYHENWIEYRNVTESLKFEKYLFLTKSGSYRDENNAFNLFVERFESLISSSTQKWVNYNSTKEDNAKK